MGVWQVGDYCDINDVKRDQAIVDPVTGIPIALTKDDDVLWDLIHEASAEIDVFCNRHFYGIAETRSFDALDDVDGMSLLLDDDLAAIGTVTLGTGDVLTTSDYILYPLNILPKHEIRLKRSSTHWWAYYTDPEAAITVSGTWGYTSGTTPPTAVKHACVEFVRWLYQKRHAPFESAGAGDLGAYTVPSNLPQEVQRQLYPFKRYRIGAVQPGGW